MVGGRAVGRRRPAAVAAALLAVALIGLGAAVAGGLGADGPAGSWTAASPLVVTTGAGTSTPISSSSFRYTPPAFRSMTPDAGPVQGGTTVVIEGTGFDFPETTVLFGDAPATVTDRTATRLTVRSPAHPAGVVDVLIVTPTGRTEPGFADRFSFGDGSWHPVGPMSVARFHHTATQLEDGRILVAGGTDDFGTQGTPLASAEVFDPASGAWTSVRPMAQARYSHSATVLDGPRCRASATPGPRPAWCGRVLVAGGEVQVAGPGAATWQPLASAEVFDPATGSWSATGPLAAHRFSHTATLLDGPACHAVAAPGYCGKVLVAGGTDTEQDNRVPLRSAELYDPGVGTWAPTGDLDPGCAVGCGRTNHTATALADGRVLAAGGLAVDPADPGGGSAQELAGINGIEVASVSHPVLSRPVGPTALVVTTADPPAGATVAPGDRITYTVRSFNIGTEASRATTSLALPATVALVSTTGGATIGADPGSGGPLVSVKDAPFPAGTTLEAPAVRFEVVVTVRDAPAPPRFAPPEAKAASPAGAIVVTSTTVVSTSGPSSNNEVTHTLARPTSLHLAQTSDPVAGSTLAPGDRVTYALAAYNTGTLAAPAAVITDRLPPEVGFVAASDRGAYDPNNGTVTFPAVAVPAGTTAEAPAATRTVTVAVLPERAGGSTVADGTLVTNRARIDGLASNPATHAVLRAPGGRAAVHLAESASPAPGSELRVGQLVTYTIAAFDTGSTAAAGIVVSDALPLHLDFVSASGAGTFDTATRTVTFPAVDVPAGSTAAAPGATFTVTARVRAGDGLSEVNAARADTATARLGVFANQVEHPLAVLPLRLIVEAVPPANAPVAPGGAITYTVAAFNRGSEAAEATITESFPIGTRFVSATDGGTFDRATGVVRFPPVTVSAGTTATSPARRLSVTVVGHGLTAPTRTSEVYDPARGTWAATAGAMGLARFDQTATLLGVEPCGPSCGKVLVSGGIGRVTSDGMVPTATAELFDPATGTWAPTGSLRTARGGHTASVLADGRVLAAGGSVTFPTNPARPLSAAELYDPASGTWHDTAAMQDARGIHTAIVVSGPRCAAPVAVVPCGEVLVSGGGTTAAGSTPPSPPATARAEAYHLADLPPSVAGLTPGRGPTHGATEVTVTGSGFDKVGAVTFGGVTALSVQVTSPTRLVAIAPPHRSGLVPVVVQATGGSSAAVAAGAFTYEVSDPPGRSADLAARALSGTEIVLTFSAAASDGPFPPPAARYDVRQAPAPMTDEAGFVAGVALCDGGCRFAPSAVGDRLTLDVADLRPGTTYHYTLRAVSDTGQPGALSNPGSAATTADGSPATPPQAVSGAPVVGPSVGRAPAPPAAPKAATRTGSGAPGAPAARGAMATTTSPPAQPTVLQTVLASPGPTAGGEAEAAPGAPSADAGRHGSSHPWAVGAGALVALAGLGFAGTRLNPWARPA